MAGDSALGLEQETHCSCACYGAEAAGRPLSFKALLDEVIGSGRIGSSSSLLLLLPSFLTGALPASSIAAFCLFWFKY